jgi:hypothetical protein
MQKIEHILDIYQKRGAQGLPLECVYRQLFNPGFYLLAFSKLYAHHGAMTPGSEGELVDGVTLEKIRQIIKALRAETFRWRPARRVYIPTRKGGTRPLGLPDGGDKVVQEVLRALLQAYYEPKFSGHSHGFRPHRSCQTALREIHREWTATVWFIDRANASNLAQFGSAGECFREKLGGQSRRFAFAGDAVLPRMPLEEG